MKTTLFTYEKEIGKYDNGLIKCLCFILSYNGDGIKNENFNNGKYMKEYFGEDRDTALAVIRQRIGEWSENVEVVEELFGKNKKGDYCLIDGGHLFTLDRTGGKHIVFGTVI